MRLTEGRTWEWYIFTPPLTWSRSPAPKLENRIIRLTILDLSSELVRRFLVHLEDERSCCAYTRNQRLTTIRHHIESLREHGEPVPEPHCTATVVDVGAAAG